MSWEDLEKEDTVNRVSSLYPDALASGDVSRVEKTERYNSMKVVGVGVSGEVIKGSPLYYTDNQEIDVNENYIIFNDLRSQFKIPVSESVVEDLWGEYLFEVN